MRLTYSGAFPSFHQVLPDGCMDIIFDLRGERVEVIGTMTRAVEIESVSGFDLCGFRFKPGGIYPFTRIDASEFTDNSAPAGDVLDSWIHMTLVDFGATFSKAGWNQCKEVSIHFSPTATFKGTRKVRVSN